MGIFVSTVLFTTNDCSRQLSASSVVVYHLHLESILTPHPIRILLWQRDTTILKQFQPELHGRKRLRPQTWLYKYRSNNCSFILNTLSSGFGPNSHFIYFVIAVIAFYNMNDETHRFNSYLNDLEADISNGWTKWVALDGNISIITLSSATFLHFKHFNGCIIHHK